jgi:hypothetical protein
MKKVLVLASLLLIVGIVTPAHAEECSNADLRGLYSFVASGTLGGLPFATAGQTQYDGNGGVTGLIQISVNGTVTNVIPWSGTYRVNPDCTITKIGVVPGFPNLHFFVTAGDNFKELRFIATNPGTTISGTARKQH